MKVRFDVVSRPDFLLTLADLGAVIRRQVLQELHRISDTLSWKRFCAVHDWRTVAVRNIDSFPGAPDYHAFVVTLAGGEAIQIVGFLNWEAQVICAVALQRLSA